MTKQLQVSQSSHLHNQSHANYVFFCQLKPDKSHHCHLSREVKICSCISKRTFLLTAKFLNVAHSVISCKVSYSVTDLKMSYHLMLWLKISKKTLCATNINYHIIPYKHDCLHQTLYIHTEIIALTQRITFLGWRLKWNIPVHHKKTSSPILSMRTKKPQNWMQITMAT
jgi:hypothetical protein